jgi:outer membrane receptor protein involved in Fe transport
LLTPAPVVLPAQRVEKWATDDRRVRGIRRYTRQQIDDAGYRDVAEALDGIPGVRVIGSAETPGGRRVSVAGASPLRVGVLWDGFPLAAGADGSVDLDAIPLAAVSGIDVLPGGQSAGFGDGAMGGAVNIRTDQDDSESHRVELTAGRYDAYGGVLTATERFGRFRGQWSLERLGRGDTFEYPDSDSMAVRRGVGTDSWRGHAGLSHGILGDGKVTVSVYRSDVGMPGALEQLTPGARMKNRQFRMQGSWETRLGSGWRSGIGVWHENVTEHATVPGRIPYDNEFRERFIGGRTHLGRTSAGFEMRNEFEFRNRRLEGFNIQRPHLSFGMTDRVEFTLRMTARKAWPVGAQTLTVSAAGAIDGDDRAAPFYMPRIDLAWTMPMGVAIRSGWGRSFRRPLLTSLFWKADAFAVGNPDLRPERASEWDIGLTARRGPLSVDTRYFERRVTDIIFWQRSTATGQYQPGNIDRTFVFGREDHVSLELFARSIALDYIHVFRGSYDRSGEVNYDGDVLTLSPRHTHELDTRVKLGRYSGRLSARRVSLRYLRRDNQSGKMLQPYGLFDVYMRVEVRRTQPRVHVGVHIDNLTNERVDLLERYPSPGRSWSIRTAIEL